jgi:hypothetical protein
MKRQIKRDRKKEKGEEKENGETIVCSFKI